MAIINSVAIGRGRGKLGNIIYQSYNGMTIVRQKNDTISTFPTTLQIQQRARMFNAGSSISYLHNFLTYWKPRSFNLLSSSSAFVSLTCQSFDNFRAANGSVAMNQLNGKIFGENRFIVLTGFEFVETLGVKTGIKAFLRSNTEQLEDNLVLHLLCQHVDNTDPAHPIATLAITSSDIIQANIDAGFIIITIEDFDTTSIVAYVDQYYSYSDALYFAIPY